MIDSRDPKAKIHWTMASAPYNTFTITVEDLLLCAVLAKTEAEFRASYYRLGEVLHVNRDKRRALAAGAGV